MEEVKNFNSMPVRAYNSPATKIKPEELIKGQLGVLYKKGSESLSLKNDDGRILTIPFTGGEGGSSFIIYDDENYSEDGIFPSKESLYDSLRNHIDSQEQLFEPVDGKMCVAFAKNTDTQEIETYPIVSPEPSFDSLVDPQKTKRASEIKVHRLPYGGNKIVVRRHLMHRPMVNLPYYFQDGVCIFRRKSDGVGSVIKFRYDSSMFEFSAVTLADAFNIEINDIEKVHGCDKELVITRINSYHGNAAIWIRISFNMLGHNVFEAKNLIYNDGSYFLSSETVKLGYICEDEYRNRTTLSPYLKLEWGNYMSGGNDAGCDDSETNKPKLVNIRPSLWKGVINSLDEKIYANREPGRYEAFIESVFGGKGKWPKPRYRVRSKIRNYIPVYSPHETDEINNIYPEICDGKLIIHYHDSLASTTADLTKEYIEILFTRKYYGSRVGDITLRIYLNKLNTGDGIYYTVFEPSDFPEFENVEDGFLGYDIKYDMTKCYSGNYQYSKYFKTLAQQDFSRTNRWPHKLSGWHWCNSNKEYQIIDGRGRYHGNKSYSIMLHKKHRGVVSAYPCHLSIIKENKKKIIEGPDYLTFDIISGGTIEFDGMSNDVIINRNLDYRINDGDWNQISSASLFDENKFNVNAGDKVELKAKFEEEDEQSINGFATLGKSTAVFNVSGNIMSLIGYDNFEELDALKQDYVFMGLFENCKIVDASGLKLSAKELRQFCYYRMFKNCTMLVNLPRIETEALEPFCYSNMFEGCSSLVTIPFDYLPAESCDAQGCYSAMFKNCTNLNTLPNLPATAVSSSSYDHMFAGCSSLVNVPENYLNYNSIELVGASCYAGMFAYCTSLTSVPKIPSPTKWSNACFCNMFEGCSSLTSVPSDLLPFTELPYGCYREMFKNCTALVNAPNLPAEDLTTGENYKEMFSGCESLRTAPIMSASTLGASSCQRMFYYCTSLTIAPELPATTLIGNYCCKEMFMNCTSLTTAPSILPSSNAIYGCYMSMFYNCTSLTAAPVLPATTLSDWSYHEMFVNCKSLTTAPDLPAETLGKSCCRYMFRDCTGLTTAPSILPATTLADYCYDGMFMNCTSLTTAPELPAETLVERCYMSLFQGCSSLNFIKCLATDISATDGTFSWVRDVASTGTFVKSPDMNWETSVNGIPTGWEVQDAS